MNAIYPVILSGGSGTRLWPLSRAMYPKQFIRAFNDQGSSFLAATLQRLRADDRDSQASDSFFAQRRSLRLIRVTGRHCERGGA